MTIQTGFHNGGRDYENNHKESFDCTYILLQNSVSPLKFNMLSPPRGARLLRRTLGTRISLPGLRLVLSWGDLLCQKRLTYTESFNLCKVDDTTAAIKPAFISSFHDIKQLKGILLPHEWGSNVPA